MEHRPAPFEPIKRLNLKPSGPAAPMVSVQAPKPAAVSSWPPWARVLALKRRPEDKGLGDTAVHWIGDKNSEAFKERFKEWTGHDCGCSDRQAWLNRHYAYPERVLHV